MKAVHVPIEQYNTKFPISIDILEQRTSLYAITVADSGSDDQKVTNLKSLKVGVYVQKFFPSHGWLEGTIT